MNGITVVTQDGFDQVLADIVYIAVNRGQHDRAFADTLDSVHETL